MIFKVKAIFYDYDGTLVNSKKVIFDGINLVLGSRGLTMIKTKELMNIAGMPLQKGLAKRFEGLTEEEIRGCQTDFDAYMRVASMEYKLIEGTKDALSYFRKKGAIQAVITSAPRHQVDHDLSRFGLHEFLELVISREDVDNHKPAPDSILKALTSLKVNAEESLYVGDSYVDLAAGKRAGVRTIGVLTGFCDRGVLENGDPDMIIDSVADLPKVVEVISA